MAKTIFLLRHAESESNKLKYFGGWTTSPLTELGQQQARALTKRLDHENIDKTFCSDLTRAKQTFQAIGLNCPVEYAKELREKNYGELEGRTWDPKIEKHRNAHLDPYHKPLGGESAEEMQKRVVKYFNEKILNAPEEKILVVSHHGALVTFMCNHLHTPLTEWRKFRLGNAGLSILSYEENTWRLTLWNSLSHYGLENFAPLFEE